MDPTESFPRGISSSTTSLARLIGTACAAFVAGVLATALLGGVLSFLPEGASKALTSGTLLVYVFMSVFFAAAIAVGATVLDGGRPHFVPALPTGVPASTPRVADRMGNPLSPDVLALVRQPRAPSKNAWLTFGLTFVLFAVWIGSGSTMVSGIVLMATLLFHEAGHWVAMRVFGYRDSRIFFVPFLGAATAGTKVGAPGWQECAVLLMGPLPGLLLAVLLSPMTLMLRFTSFAGAHTWVHAAMSSLVIVNLLNLLPLAAFDGGRMWMRLLFSRRPLLEVVADAAMGAGLALLGAKLSSWVLVGLGALSVLTIQARYRIATATRRLRERGLVAPLDLESAPDDYVADLLAEVREAFRHKPMKPATEVSLVRSLHERLVSGPMGMGATLLFLALYFVAVLVGIFDAILLVSDRSTATSAKLTQSYPMKNGLVVAHYPTDFAATTPPGDDTVVVTRATEGVAWMVAPSNAGQDVASWSPQLLATFAQRQEAGHEKWTETSRVAGPCFRSYPGLLVTSTYTKDKGTWKVRMCLFATPSAGYAFETRVPVAREATVLPLLQKILEATEIK